jgi:hypothetical protein
MTKEVCTFWLHFFDPTAPRRQRFLGVAIVDMNDNASRVDVVRHTLRLGINPGGGVSITKLNAQSALKIATEYRNKLITDGELLGSLAAGIA